MENSLSTCSHSKIDVVSNFFGVDLKFMICPLLSLLMLTSGLSFLGGGLLPTPAFASCTLPSGVGGGGLDTDCDAISDAWEGVSSAFPGANINHKDIFVEIDYMTGFIPDSLNVITPVVNAFNAIPNSLANNPDGLPGITLHVVVSDSIPLVDPLNLWTDFDSTKSSWFARGLDPATKAMRTNVYHYGLFIRTFEDASTPGSDAFYSGKSKDSRNFVVSLGNFAGSNDQKQGSLMHEIGHNLGLRHGGSVDENCKPNYLSVMSYSFQFSNLVGTRPLDYSRSVLGELNEAHLNEGYGVSASTPTGLKTIYGPSSPGPLKVRTTGQPFDWNRNGYYYDPDVSSNINELGISDCNYQTISTLSGYDDWSNLKFWGTGITQPGNTTSVNIQDLSQAKLLFDNETFSSDKEIRSQDVIQSRFLLLKGLENSTQAVNDSSFVNNGSKIAVMKILKNQVEPFLNVTTELNLQKKTSDLLVPEASRSGAAVDPGNPLEDAIQGLLSLRERLDGDVGGNQTDDWISDPNVTRPLIEEIDNYVAALRSQIP